MAYRFVPNMNIDAVEHRLFNEDIVLAKKLLSAAGYDNVLFFPKLRILCSKKKTNRTIAKFLKKEWEDKLNLDVEILYLDWSDSVAAKRQ